MKRIAQMLGWVAIMTMGAPAWGGEQPAHPEVRWALDYELPEHRCKKPRLRASNQPDQLDRFERKVKRYTRCVADYQTTVIGDHQRIVAAAEHGITETQAHAMLDKLRQIEAAVVALGEDVVVELDPTDVDRLLTIGNRPSI